MDTNFVFEEPWEPVEKPEILMQQLLSELSPGHVLEGKAKRVLACRVDGDDILVETQDGYAMVHLTWCKRSRASLPFPHTVVFDSWEDFLNRSYLPERAEWREENPASEWEEMLE